MSRHFKIGFLRTKPNIFLSFPQKARYKTIDGEKQQNVLKILLKYGNPKYPTQCSHDELNIVGVEPEKISKEDVKKLSKYFQQINCWLP